MGRLAFPFGLTDEVFSYSVVGAHSPAHCAVSKGVSIRGIAQRPGLSRVRETKRCENSKCQQNGEIPERFQCFTLKLQRRWCSLILRKIYKLTFVKSATKSGWSPGQVDRTQEGPSGNRPNGSSTTTRPHSFATSIVPA